ncbi:site-specific DNA-methyltransferase [Endozoicomonas atrinae]|uniref:site-specific DNA-methyltransferase n=1 Tax=Endozoicomonas atrinae TaxID=1333660 RepID=UPI001EE713F3|nr:site-specific DNA-methyltransferase [Endozoicomonas atrinae]
MTQAQRCAYRLLEEVPELSYGDTASGNLLVQGDNLEALKALIPFYAGQVKCIYIDPPYNTRSAFEHYDDNLEHSKWLSLIYPRLELLRELLAEDGSIWVSIDDNEAHYLKVIMDEVFGRANFISNTVWQKKYAPSNDAKSLSEDHEHLMVYTKNHLNWNPNKIKRSESALKAYKNPDNDPRGPWKSSDYTCNKNNIERPNLYYPIRQPVTGEEVWPKKTAVWRYQQETHLNHVQNNLIWWGKNGTNKVPAYKRFLSSIDTSAPHQSIWLWQDVGHTQDAKREVQVLNQESPFATPKPEKLLERIIYISTNPGDLVLDSFLGSGTTAAVAHKMGRRYIGIEIGEHAQTHCQPRLKKVVDGEQGGISKAVEWQGGGGFRFYQLGQPVFDDYGSLNPEIKFNTLASHLWYLETKTPLNQKAPSAFLGVSQDIAYYLLYNGILGDRRPDGGNVLTGSVLSGLPDIHDHQGRKIVIYGESTRLGEGRLKQANITFKQIPYDVGAL